MTTSDLRAPAPHKDKAAIQRQRQTMESGQPVHPIAG